MSLIVKIYKKMGDFTLNVNFSTENEIFALLGASGCGKSMTLKCIAGIEKPDSGQIILDDEILFDSVKKINLPPQKRKVGYLFQDYALFNTMTVEKNIESALDSKEKSNVYFYCKAYHLEGLEKLYPEQLSGGQKQRVAMARMMAAKPKVIMLDEPFSALDSYLREKMMWEMKAVLDQLRIPVLFVSHDRNEVYAMSNRVTLIDQGHSLETMEKNSFFHNPKTISAAVLSGCKNISKVKRLNDHHYMAQEWNTIIYCEEVLEDIAAVGIRAHDFDLNSESSNVFTIDQYRLSEDLFEWNVFFQTDSGSGELLWKISKNMMTQEILKEFPAKVFVQSDRILFLKE